MSRVTANNFFKDGLSYLGLLRKLSRHIAFGLSIHPSSVRGAQWLSGRIEVEGSLV